MTNDTPSSRQPDTDDNTIGWEAMRPQPRPSAKTDEAFGRVDELFGAIAEEETPPPRSNGAIPVLANDDGPDDPERTVAYDFASRLDDPPVEETKLLEIAPPQTVVASSSSMTASRPATRWSAQMTPVPIPSTPVVLALGSPRTSRRRATPPLPLWVHIALASAFVCCAVLGALVVVLLNR